MMKPDALAWVDYGWELRQSVAWRQTDIFALCSLVIMNSLSSRNLADPMRMQAKLKRV